MRICAVVDCEKPHHKREWCSAHYQRWLKYGDPLGSKPREVRWCEVDGCGRKHFVKGYCKKHHYRWERYGDPLMLTRRPGGRTIEEGFRWHMPGDPPKDDCWVWQRCRSDGYGQFTSRGKHILAHVASYKIFNGVIPSGQEVRHTCDNPPCVNPSHLIIGTHAENMWDMVERGRRPNGENLGSKLTEVAVREIRLSWSAGDFMVSELAEIFDVHKATIRAVVHRKTWKHVA